MRKIIVKDNLKLYGKALYLTTKIVELTEKTGDVNLSREQVLKNEANYKVKAIATAISYEIARRWGVLRKIIVLSQKEPLNKSTSLLRALLTVGTYELLFSKKKINLMATALEPYIKRITNIKILNRFKWVLNRVNEFKYPNPPKEDILEFAFWKLYFPKWITKKFLNLYGDKTLNILEILNTDAPISLRANIKKISSQELLNLLKEKYGFEGTISKLDDNFIVLKKSYPVVNIKEFEEGYFTIQDDVVGFLIRKLCENFNFTSILDACAAPGRKTSYFSMLKENLKVFASDVSYRRLKSLKKLYKTLDLPLPYLTVLDARNLPFKKSFDLILLDVPCTGTGTLRKHPERRWFLKEDDIDKKALIQRQILKEASKFAKNYLVYSTCSLFREENEEQVQNFLKENKDFKLIEEKRFDPSLEYKTGFYYAIMEKT